MFEPGGRAEVVLCQRHLRGAGGFLLSSGGGGSGAAARGERGGRSAPAELPPPLWFMAPRDPPGSCRLSSGLGSFCSLYTRSFIYIYIFFYCYFFPSGSI